MSVDSMRSAMDLLDKVVVTLADAEDLMRSGIPSYEDRTIERVHDAALNLGLACAHMRRELAGVETNMKRRATDAVPANTERLLPADRRRDAGKQDALVGRAESSKGV